MSLTAEQLEMRKTGIGASETPMLLGESPHGGPVALYMRKVGLEVQDQSPEQEMGHILEPAVAEYYARRTGATIAEATTYRHPECPWLLATPDRWVNGRQKLLQIKCVGQWMAHHWTDADDGIPDYVRVQVTQEMDVCGVQRCDVAALICGTRPRIYQVEFDPELADLIREATRAFWFDHIEAREPPAPDGSEESALLIKRLYPNDRTPLMPATDAMEALAQQLRTARREAGRWEDRGSLLEQRMKVLLGDVQGARGTDWTVTWKTSKAGTRPFLFVPDEERKKRGKAA